MQNVENNALLTAYGYQAESGLEKNEASTAETGADLGALGGLASSASSLGFKWNGLQG